MQRSFHDPKKHGDIQSLSKLKQIQNSFKETRQNFEKILTYVATVLQKKKIELKFN